MVAMITYIVFVAAQVLPLHSNPNPLIYLFFLLVCLLACLLTLLPHYYQTAEKKKTKPKQNMSCRQLMCARARAHVHGTCMMLFA